MPDKEINSHILRLQGKAELPEEIELGNNYHIALEGSIIATTETDNENGTVDRTYTFRPVKMEVLTPKGKMLKLKDRRSESQKFKAKLYKEWEEDPAQTLSFDDFYHKLMTSLRLNSAEIISNYLPR